MQKHLIVNFQSLNQADLLAKVTHIVGCLKDNPNFPPPWPAPVPPLAQVEALVNDYGRAYQAALNGDRLKIADGNEAALLSTGYALSHEPARSKTKAEAGGPGQA